MGTGDFKGAMIPTATMMIMMIAPRPQPPKLSHPHGRGHDKHNFNITLHDHCKRDYPNPSFFFF
jgi:hypothetical protein